MSAQTAHDIAFWREYMAHRQKPAGGKNAVRKIIGDLLIVFLVLFTVYLSAVMLHRIHTVVLKETYRKIFRNELLLCAVMLLAALDLRFGFFTLPRAKVLRAPGWVLRLAVIAAALLILFFCGRVIAGSLIRSAGEAENAIVLGMALENGKPQKDLLLRLDTAQRYWEEHPEATLILTGGNPDESGVTEAGVMRELLAERGVPEESTLLEDKAATTKENFLNTAQMLDPDAPVVLISSDYHMDRAAAMAEAAGFTRILRLPAPSEPLYYGANLMWEVVLDLNELISGSSAP